MEHYLNHPTPLTLTEKQSGEHLTYLLKLRRRLQMRQNHLLYMQTLICLQKEEQIDLLLPPLKIQPLP